MPPRQKFLDDLAEAIWVFEVNRVSRDSETFSSRFEPGAPDGIDYLGISGIPRPRGIPPTPMAASLPKKWPSLVEYGSTLATPPIVAARCQIAVHTRIACRAVLLERSRAGHLRGQ